MIPLFLWTQRPFPKGSVPGSTDSVRTPSVGDREAVVPEKPHGYPSFPQPRRSGDRHGVRWLPPVEGSVGNPEQLPVLLPKVAEGTSPNRRRQDFYMLPELRALPSDRPPVDALQGESSAPFSGS